MGRFPAISHAMYQVFHTQEKSIAVDVEGNTRFGGESNKLI